MNMDKYPGGIYYSGQPDIYDRDFYSKYEAVFYSLVRKIVKKNTTIGNFHKVIPDLLQRYKKV